MIIQQIVIRLKSQGRRRRKYFQISMNNIELVEGEECIGALEGVRPLLNIINTRHEERMNRILIVGVQIFGEGPILDVVKDIDGNTILLGETVELADIGIVGENDLCSHFSNHFVLFLS